MKSRIFVLAMSLPLSVWAENRFELEKNAILKQAGCFIVDYNFAENASLKEGYQRDSRFYETNLDKTTYELIIPIQKSPTEIRLQHVLFLRDLKTGEVQGLMKHHAEDWEYESAKTFQYEGIFESQGIKENRWTVDSNVNAGTWTRKTTNLDDGIRYQCKGSWSLDRQNPEFSCANFAPIPGRETRDMGRKDYNTLQRQTKVIVYKDHWLERQNNQKTIFQEGEQTPLASELGKIWFLRQAMSECADAAQYAKGQLPYWTALMETWESEFEGRHEYREMTALRGMPRYAALLQVEAVYSERLGKEPSLKQEVMNKIREVISKYRL